MHYLFLRCERYLLYCVCLFLLKFYCCFLSFGMNTQLCPFVSFSNYFFLSCFLVILSLPKCNNKAIPKVTDYYSLFHSTITSFGDYFVYFTVILESCIF